MTNSEKKQESAFSESDTCRTSDCGDSTRHQTPRGKLHCFNWLDDIPGGGAESDLVEVQFKNTRKGFFRNSLKLPLEVGELVAVEASPGHDIGEVTLTGRLVGIQMKKAGVKPDTEIRRVLRQSPPT